MTEIVIEHLLERGREEDSRSHALARAREDLRAHLRARGSLMTLIAFLRALSGKRPAAPPGGRSAYLPGVKNVRPLESRSVSHTARQLGMRCISAGCILSGWRTRRPNFTTQLLIPTGSKFRYIKKIAPPNPRI